MWRSTRNGSGRLIAAGLLLLGCLWACSGKKDSEQSQERQVAPLEKWGQVLLALKPDGKNEALVYTLYSEEKGYQTFLVQLADHRATYQYRVPVAVLEDGQGGFLYGWEQVRHEEEKPYPDAGDDLDSVVRMITERTLLLSKNAGAFAPFRRAEVKPLYDSDNYPAGRSEYSHTGTELEWVEGPHITLADWGEQYTGGAHPNHYRIFRAGRIKAQAPDTLDLRALSLLDCVWLQNRTGSDWLRIRRELYFRGAARNFIDAYEDSARTFRLSDYEGQEVGPFEDFYQPWVDSAYAILLHRDGQTRLLARADASASYAESGDYTLTTEVDLGAYPKAYKLPFVFEHLGTLLENLSDAWLSSGQNYVLLLREEKEGQFRLQLAETVTASLLEDKVLKGKVVQVRWLTGATERKAWEAALKAVPARK